ncbi:DMT family transporter [Donghicola eburneus]|uniref:Multidrug DMT transporter permease n=1 Tax=Donghicola eburneus TaxID=393278 RepID=A0A1M4N1D0_9RHOB|nr:DMT family transporter [Donghicola eburneus]SCM67877.1 multidrug DMT transporter permease [Donghicola eburneus]
MSPVLRGCLWMSGAILSFSAMAIAGREVSTNLDTFEIMLYRSLIGFLIVLAVASLAGTRGDIKTDRLPLHLVRNLCHFTAQNLWFFAITVVPLAQVFAIEFSAPLWALLMSAIILNERLTKNRVIAGIAGFVGILVITRPGVNAIGWAQLTPALAAIGFAASAVTTRLLTRTERITSIMFWLTGMQFVFGLICAGIDLDIAVPTAANLPLVTVIAICGVTAHFCLTTALSLAPASIVMPIDFLRLPLIAAIGALMYSEVLDVYVALGALIIITANYANIRIETRKS